MESCSPHPLAGQAQACGRLRQEEGPEGAIAPVVTTGGYKKKNLEHGRATCQHSVGVQLFEVSWIPLASLSMRRVSADLPAVAGRKRRFLSVSSPFVTIPCSMGSHLPHDGAKVHITSRRSGLCATLCVHDLANSQSRATKTSPRVDLGDTRRVAQRSTERCSA